MADVEFKANKGALKSIMQSGEILGEVQSVASRICSTANASSKGTYIVKSDIGKVSARAVVVTADIVAIKSNAKHNTLLKSIG